MLLVFGEFFDKRPVDHLVKYIRDQDVNDVWDLGIGCIGVKDTPLVSPPRNSIKIK
jgi:hypothetical protein